MPDVPSGVGLASRHLRADNRELRVGQVSGTTASVQDADQNLVQTRLRDFFLALPYEMTKIRHSRVPENEQIDALQGQLEISYGLREAYPR